MGQVPQVPPRGAAWPWGSWWSVSSPRGLRCSSRAQAAPSAAFLVFRRLWKGVLHDCSLQKQAFALVGGISGL